jgi:peptide/nickel transport system permease protein
MAVFGLGVIILLVLLALFADIISPYSPTEIHSGNLSENPSGRFLLGTDYLGRDILSRLMHGSRVSIVIGIFSVVFSLIIGIPLGMISGYYGGKSDMIIMRSMEVLMAFPIFLLAIMIMVILGPSLMNVIISLGIVRIPIFARLVRGSVLSIKQKEFVSSAQALAFSDKRILFRHILPNCLGPIIVLATLNVGNSIIIEASLSFLGLGCQPPTPSWGFDLKTALRFIEVDYWPIFPPGLAIMLTVMGLNLFGDGLRDALDPKMKY